MIWLAVLLLAAAGIALAVRPLGLPQSALALLGTAMALGLAGYALQGSPGLPGAATPPRAASPQSMDVLIAARRAMFGGVVPPARYVAVADGFARQGQTQDAAGFLQLATAENPRDAEAWVALGNVLVAHAGGALTPPAEEAFERGGRLAPANPAVAYFKGFAKLRMGDAPAARELWGEALAKIPADAAYRPIIAGQLAQLDEAIRRGDGQRTGVEQAAPLPVQ